MGLEEFVPNLPSLSETGFVSSVNVLWEYYRDTIEK
jgi:hypothetical protein